MRWLILINTFENPQHVTLEMLRSTTKMVALIMILYKPDDGHLRFPIRTILTTVDLQVTSILSI